ncbi:MAG TPA: adenylate/guanylate cyclase domain-containing protein [Gemmatimonadota bacterium]|nr:adenylate/guanylate cyclase domain-containing protein [Gemmatimonadota bacterium]
MTARFHRLAAICFADIAGYTKLSATNESQALDLVGVLQNVARRIVEDHGGRIVKFMGDAVLIEFSSTYDAVHSAIEIRDHFTADASSAGLGPRDLSIGVHVDDVVAEEDGDVYGDGVNIASRIQAAAEPGHVWVSEDAWRQLRQHPEFRFDARGSRELKGIAEPVAVYDVAMVGAETGEPANVEPGGVPPKQSVAVLPFANLSPVKENEYFSDGVTEEILALLARIEGLKVISRTSIMRYKGTSKSLRQIGEELGAATILEGSVRQAGHRVRISAQLIDALYVPCPSVARSFWYWRWIHRLKVCLRYPRIRFATHMSISMSRRFTVTCVWIARVRIRTAARFPAQASMRRFP